MYFAIAITPATINKDKTAYSTQTKTKLLFFCLASFGSMVSALVAVCMIVGMVVRVNLLGHPAALVR